MALFSGQPE